MRTNKIMNVPIDNFIEESNLSVAWARAFLALASRRDEEIVPLAISLTGFSAGEPIEDPALRAALDSCLVANGHQASNTVANTIFPLSLWRQVKGNRDRLYEEYLENLPSYVEMAKSKNHSGLYFSRLVAFGVDPRTGAALKDVNIGKLPGLGNQLEYLIPRCKKGVRKSLFQASIFDPGRDHIGGAQQGFPCMQHITFVPDFDKKTLAVNAFYATQQLYVKAYGNLLGLTRLGAFFASQVGLNLAKVSCFAGVEKMDQRPAAGATLDALIAAAEATIRNSQVSASKAAEVIG